MAKDSLWEYEMPEWQRQALSGQARTRKVGSRKRSLLLPPLVPVSGASARPQTILCRDFALNGVMQRHPGPRRPSQLSF